MVEGMDFEGYDPDSAAGCWIRIQHFYARRCDLPDFLGRFYPYFPRYPGFRTIGSHERWLPIRGMIDFESHVILVRNQEAIELLPEVRTNADESGYVGTFAGNVVTRIFRHQVFDVPSGKLLEVNWFLILKFKNIAPQ